MECNGQHLVGRCDFWFGGTVRLIIISRILGGDVMAAIQLNHGRQAEELIEAVLMMDWTDVAEAGSWKDIVNPPALLDSCTLDGQIYCAPIIIHSAQSLWLASTHGVKSP
jgi:glucose/mannose transport system substrate-binding protein